MCYVLRMECVTETMESVYLNSLNCIWTLLEASVLFCAISELDYQPLFGKWAPASPNALGEERRSDSSWESDGNQAQEGSSRLFLYTTSSRSFLFGRDESAKRKFNKGVECHAFLASVTSRKLFPTWLREKQTANSLSSMSRIYIKQLLSPEKLSLLRYGIT